MNEKNKVLIFSIESSIKNRIEVLENFDKYKIDEKHRIKLTENLNYFQNKLKGLK